ncbi:3-hydroxyacyl-CoA dehydrogenase family protein [Methylobacterium terricola]|uniref:3-hydroxyacyl-CoA dehydrogenase family protein n=2 Tax=Methylobacterium terricola TaxID=2583531 RepID=A0A5C4L918_9HYPH|nr:3-hydroxyacyl-CoA dehydrogenase family protein [Methylobacterium terricola]
MGAAIAYAFALKGASVLLADVDRTAAEQGVAAVAEIGASAVRRGAPAPGDLPALLGRIAPVDGLDPLAPADIAVEAMGEAAALKRDVLGRLEAMLRPEALLATSTAALSIDGLADGLAAPSRLVGLHIASPVELWGIVEIVRGRRSAAAALARAHDDAGFLGKGAIQVRDRHGFFAGRVLRAFVNEAAAMVGEGVAPALVENAALQAGYLAAPLALIDDASLSLAAEGIAGARGATRGPSGRRRDPGAAGRGPGRTARRRRLLRP